MSVRILHGDCRAVMATLAEASVDAIVCDPPYELGFMGKGWDSTGVANDVETWRQALRVLKPGGHLLAFSGTRTYHRMVCAIEDAGFEVRDQIQWIYSSGFPKSHNLDRERERAICGCSPTEQSAPSAERDVRSVLGPNVSAADDARGERREVLQPRVPEQGSSAAGRPELPGAEDGGGEPGLERRGDATQSARELRTGALRESARVGEADGACGRLRDGTSVGDGRVVRIPADADGSGAPRRSRSAAERAPEPRTVAGQPEPQAGRAWPLCRGCGLPVVPGGLGTALKPAHEPIVLARKPLVRTVAANVLQHGTGALNIDGCRVEGDARPRVQSDRRSGANGTYGDGLGGSKAIGDTTLGRWPANVIHDGSDEVLAAFPQAPGQSGAVTGSEPTANGFSGTVYGYGGTAKRATAVPRGDAGSAARFFYCAKADRADRNEGLEGLEGLEGRLTDDGRKVPADNAYQRGKTTRKNHHPTVKPTDLMRYLCRLVTPPGGTVLDPFMGSGSTLKAAELEGFSAIGIELDPDYIEIARRRVACDAPLFADVEVAA